jgi:hypothetical protein
MQASTQPIMPVSRISLTNRLTSLFHVLATS